jgi:PAS domain S-box-containing protein
MSAADPPRSRDPDALLADPVFLLQSLPEGVLHAVNERITFVNDAMARILGERAQALVGRNFLDLVDPDDFKVVEERYWRRQRGERTVPALYETSLRRADGTRIQVQLEPRAIGPRELLMLVRDVSGRVRDSALVMALSELALEVVRARTPAEVLRVAGGGLRRLGLQLVVARIEGDQLSMAHTELGPGLEQALTGLLGAPPAALRLPLASLRLTPRALREHRSVFEDVLPARACRTVARVAPWLSSDRIEAELLRAVPGKGVLCPLLSNGELWGLLAAAGDGLHSADAAALGLFASQVSSALEICGTIGDLERRNRELASIHQVATAGSELELGSLACELSRLFAEATGSDGASLWLLDPERADLALAGEHGLGGRLSQRHRRIPLSSPPGGPGPLPADVDSAFSERLRADPAFEGFRQAAVLPLSFKGAPAGAWWLGRRSERPYEHEELASAALLSNQIAIRVENARLYDEAQRRLKLLSVLFDLSRIGTEALEVDPLVERLLDHTLKALRAEGGALLLADGSELVLAGQRGRAESARDPAGEAAAPGGPLAREVAASRRTLVCNAPGQGCPGATPAAQPALAEWRSLAAAPLVAKERLVGVIEVGRRSDEPFDEEDERLLESCAAQAGIALENARLFQSERRRVGILRLFLEVGRLITASLDIEEILEASAVSFARIAEASLCFIFLLDSKAKILKGAASSQKEIRDEIRAVRIPVEAASATAEAVRTRAPVRVRDPAQAPVVRALVERFQMRSLLALPLLVRDEPIGAVLIADTAREREYADAQVERATVVAGQVAVAVANARLYEDLKASYDELARTQEELVKRERLAALGELAAVVAHEVRNPLGVIFNSLGALERLLKPQGDAAMLLGIVGEEADRLNRIVGDMLDFVRPSELALEPEPLPPLFASVVEGAASAAENAGVMVQVQAAPDLPPVPADARQLRQALLNLLLNAIQATPKGGWVLLAARAEALAQGPMARIEVLDTGPGIPSEVAERVFLPFFTTKASGTGLGLAVVKRIVEAHRGEVFLEPGPGEGARFVIRLPLEARRSSG